jgi:serine protease Do
MYPTFRVRSGMVALVVLLSACLGAWAQPQREAKAPRSYLGVRLSPAEEGENGIVVREVTPDSPAATAGLKDDDRIVKVNDETVADIQSFLRGMADHKPGDKLRLGIVRDGKQQTLNVTLGERTAREGAVAPNAPNLGRAAFLGVQTQPLTPELRTRIDTQAESGTVVMDVLARSPAAKAGLKANDVITAINDQPVKAPEDLFTAIQKAGPGKTLTLHVMRGKENLSLKATLQDGSFGRFVTPGENRFPMVDVNSMTDQSRRIRELEHRIAELEKRIRQLEKK